MRFHRAQTREELIAAGRVFERLLAVDPGNWSALYHLGAIEVLIGSREHGIAWLDAARQADPARFATSDLPAALKAEVLGRSRRPVGVASTPVEPLSIAEVQAAGADFSGPEEYARFADLAPITREELDDVDLDELLKRF
jgi:hypothetical protein